MDLLKNLLFMRTESKDYPRLKCSKVIPSHVGAIAFDVTVVPVIR